LSTERVEDIVEDECGVDGGSDLVAVVVGEHAGVVVSAVAEATSLTLLHYDVDFDLIASVTGQSSQWIVQRGSID
jgi:hypothetical protein